MNHEGIFWLKMNGQKVLNFEDIPREDVLLTDSSSSKLATWILVLIIAGVIFFILLLILIVLFVSINRCL